MLTMLEWKTRPDSHKQSVAKLAWENVEVPEGVKVLGAWHGVGLGYFLVEHQELGPVLAMTTEWAHMVEIEAHPVVLNDEAVAVLRD